MSLPPDPSWPGVLTRWSVEPPVVVLLAGVAVAFLRGRRLLEEDGHRGRPGLFAAGLGVTGLALLSPLGTYAAGLLSVHMVQHLLLVLAAAPLLVAAGPGRALLAGIPPAVASWLRRVGSSAPVGLLAHPFVAWAVFAATAWVVHFTPLFDLALRREPVHAVEHALFLGSGVLFWRPVLGAGARPSHPARLLYLALAMPQNTFLALAILSAGHPLYDAYAQLGRTWGPSVLDDQRQGAGIMWVAGDLAFLVAVLIVAAGWAAADRDAETY